MHGSTTSTHRHLDHHFNGRSPGEPRLGQPVPCWFLPPIVSEENRWRKWHTVFMGQVSFLSPSRVEALKDTQSTDTNQWPGLILSSSTTTLWKEGTCFLSAVSPMIAPYDTCIVLTRWLYYVACPQYSTQLEALGCLCDCLSGHVQR